MKLLSVSWIRKLNSRLWQDQDRQVGIETGRGDLRTRCEKGGEAGPLRIPGTVSEAGVPRLTETEIETGIETDTETETGSETGNEADFPLPRSPKG